MSCLNPAVYPFLALSFRKTASHFAVAIFHVACYFVVVPIMEKSNARGLLNGNSVHTNKRDKPHQLVRQLNELHPLNLT